MKTNDTLQKHVQDALKWEPLLRATEIGVTVHDGIVTLTGTVDSYARKCQAEDVAKRVAGVKAVVEEITVDVDDVAKPTDTEVATQVISAFKWNWAIPDDKVHVIVEKGWVTLSGEVELSTQKEAARRTVKHLTGVSGVTNNITIKANLHDVLDKMDIERALGRNWSIDGEQITVAVSGDHVTLSGTVDSVYQRDEAGRIAWQAPGVRTVDNELLIDYGA